MVDKYVDDDGGQNSKRWVKWL